MFSAEPAYTEVNPGADEVLDCQVDNIGGECRWQKDGKVSEAVNKSLRSLKFDALHKPGRRPVPCRLPRGRVRFRVLPI